MSDFFVIDYDTSDYKWFLIGSEDRKLGWILSKKPTMHKDVLDYLLRELEYQQFEINSM